VSAISTKTIFSCRANQIKSLILLFVNLRNSTYILAKNTFDRVIFYFNFEIYFHVKKGLACKLRLYLVELLKNAYVVKK